MPPARLTWILLVALGGYAVAHFGGLGLTTLIGVPIVAAIADLAFQSVRFAKLRVPDAAIATGIFVALLVPPTVPLFAAGTAAFAAIGVKHVLRHRGRPIMNPAAVGVLLGVFLLGLAPAWWAGVNTVSEVAVVVFGAFLIARNPVTWRLPVTFFLVYAPFSVLVKVLLSASLSPKLLILGVVDPATLFFGLWMVAEPRSAPRDPRLHPLFAAIVAFGAVLLPTVLPSTGVLVSLVLVGLGSAAVAAAWQLWPSRTGPSSTSRPRSRPRTSTWTVGRRTAAGVAVLVVIGLSILIAPPTYSTPSANVGLPPHSSGGGGGSSGGGSDGSGISTASCTNDSTSVPSSTLAALHKALGPSVILSYSASTGTTVFYDPVNQVTVTETDLYEDYGFAEFNGDDFAVTGCVP
ncbi:MAG: RnfABCDGE type electron transport complex subunit D [Thermoplasmata archaeon]|nr:RnfABCDGE type electron transport complex subunit D [Thermoplasmata archaeon]MCI4356851.1 RnfABCDGE type electron transport complex subunit D [Thermoplasmata archaeon]